MERYAMLSWTSMHHAWNSVMDNGMSE